MGVLISHRLSEIHFDNSIAVNEKKISKHLEHSLEISIENIKYFPLTHFSIVKDRLFKFPTNKIPDENSIPQNMSQKSF